MRYLCLVSCLIFFLAPGIVQAEFYRYRDSSGVVHYTDNLEDVPQDQRPDVATYENGSDTAAEQAGLDAKGRADDDASESGEAEESKLEWLKQTQAELDAEYQRLQEEVEALNKEREGLVNRPYNRTLYEEKVKKLNERIDAFETKRKAFEEKASQLNLKQ